MATPRSADVRDPLLAEALLRHEGQWVPMFLARAALGLTSVVWVSTAPDGAGSVALLSPVEASAWLRSRGDTKGSARVSGTPSPGSAWAVGLGASGASVWSLAMTPILTRGG
ncbi:MAG: hypothetical protein IPN17_07835 [Deltaproteobacteria bacterium]|jgi:hypothetical protein|nr:hypothetical protein [Deltaproteobacteria bacterium]MBK7069390.1 hypothetical protein [Deltaproteobacteria bacterium]MBK8692207.1 hypothetical protein [Deltaproteobacteria bacterium]MBP6830426.1 hypothetical protein [Deltaproteobacteria bacterium]